MGEVKEISVFVDESGSFAPEAEDPSCRYYHVCMVFHDQSVDLSKEIARLEDALGQTRFGRNHCVHAGPLVRREQDYADMQREERRSIFQSMLIFIRHADVKYKCFRIDKHLNTGRDAIHDSLLQDIVGFLIAQREAFEKYEKLKVYYDDGQEQITALLKEAFAIYSAKTEFVPAVQPSKYRLFQAADLACTVELVKTRLEVEGKMTTSENAFFGGEKVFRKGYLKPLERKEWQ